MFQQYSNSVVFKRDGLKLQLLKQTQTIKLAPVFLRLKSLQNKMRLQFEIFELFINSIQISDLVRLQIKQLSTRDQKTRTETTTDHLMAFNNEQNQTL